MENFIDYLTAILSIGIGATAIMDIWGFARKPLLGISPPNYCMVGRWFGHMPKGTFHHKSISAAQPVRGECLIGWIAHYLTGIGFAGIVVIVWGMTWIHRPTLAPALAVGVGTLIAPLLLMQPGMGAGIAFSRTPRPGAARIQSLITHLVFGFGLYLTGWVLNVMNS